MKSARANLRRLLPTVVVGVWAALLWSGCHNPNPNLAGSYVPPGYTQTTSAAPSEAPYDPTTGGSLAPVNVRSTARFRPGEQFRVIFSDLMPPLQPLDVRVSESGKITLYYNVTVVATGKTAAELQYEIQTNYVPRIFKNLTVTVKTEERFYYVDGEVRKPDRHLYLGYTTVTRAIATAGGTTEFASKKVELRRATGEMITVNLKKAQDEPS